tara:strand:+ start:3235 stop:3426 length:192 start_codon:yes stop_codon:yes gene_type:complete
MSEEATKLFNALVSDNTEGAKIAFDQAITSKVEDVLDVRKVGLTSQIFNNQTIEREDVTNNGT